MKKNHNVCTPEEMANAVGWTVEELDRRLEEYESGDWHLEPETKFYKGSAVDYLNNKPQSAKASFVLSPDEKDKAEEAAEAQGITFSEFCRKAVKEAVEKWRKTKKQSLNKVAM